MNEDIQQSKAKLVDRDGAFNNAEFKPVSDEQLEAFMTGKTILAVEPTSAPWVDGYVIWLDDHGLGLYIAMIEYTDEDPQRVMKASVATVAEG